MELKSSNRASVVYHDIFNYPLAQSELKKWEISRKFQMQNSKCQIENKNKFYFLRGKQEIVKNRLQNEKYSRDKLVIAKKAARLISRISNVKFVGITGSLAMNNAGKDGDIDLMIITKEYTLWTTRLLVYGLLRFVGYGLRKPKQKKEKNMLCINLWLDERDLVWHKKDRNIYTAHEIAQIIPLINKYKTYEKFLRCNRWILEYWPKSVKILGYNDIRIFRENTKSNLLASQHLSIVVSFIERFAFKLQYLYMSKKITREIVTSTRAIFHPHDWGKKVLTTLKAID